jgi:hypothetical protein
MEIARVRLLVMRRTATIAAAVVLGWTAIALTTSPTAYAASGCDSEAYGSSGGRASCDSLNGDEDARVVITCRNTAGQIYTAYGPWVSTNGASSTVFCGSSRPVVSHWGQVRRYIPSSGGYTYTTF